MVLLLLLRGAKEEEQRQGEAFFFFFFFFFFGWDLRPARAAVVRRSERAGGPGGAPAVPGEGLAALGFRAERVDLWNGAPLQGVRGGGHGRGADSRAGFAAVGSARGRARRVPPAVPARARRAARRSVS